MNNFIFFGFLMSLTFFQSVIGRPEVCNNIYPKPIPSNDMIDGLFHVIECFCESLWNQEGPGYGNCSTIYPSLLNAVEELPAGGPEAMKWIKYLLNIISELFCIHLGPY
ncbi:UNVERIFIED_CONTAM: hypothetical protein RMT77_001106 [Armadillidium vulgare]